MNQHMQQPRSAEQQASVSPEAVAVSMHIGITEEAVEYLQFITGRFDAQPQVAPEVAPAAPQAIQNPITRLHLAEQPEVANARNAVDDAFRLAA